VLAAAGAFMLLAASGLADETGIPEPKDFSEFLAARELVFVGHVVTIVGVPHYQMLGGCGTYAFTPRSITQLGVRVTRSWLGVAPDSIVNVTLVRQDQFPKGMLKVDADVLVWAQRVCDDGWRIWGDLCVVEDGVLFAGSDDWSSVRLEGQRADAPLTLKAVEAAVARPATMHPDHAFDGCAALALGRLVSAASIDTAHAVFECDSLAWALGHGAAVPRRIEFPIAPDCHPQIYPGDTLLIPVPRTSAGGTVALHACPAALKVTRGFVPGLGVRVAELATAFRRDSLGLHPRTIVARD